MALLVFAAGTAVARIVGSYEPEQSLWIVGDVWPDPEALAVRAPGRDPDLTFQEPDGDMAEVVDQGVRMPAPRLLWGKERADHVRVIEVRMTSVGSCGDFRINCAHAGVLGRRGNRRVEQERGIVQDETSEPLIL